MRRKKSLLYKKENKRKSSKVENKQKKSIILNSIPNNQASDHSYARAQSIYEAKSRTREDHRKSSCIYL